MSNLTNLLAFQASGISFVRFGELMALPWLVALAFEWLGLTRAFRPVVAAGGPGAVLAMLVGVNVGPNLTYTGSLATLLWRRVMRAHEEAVDLSQFTRLGLLTVPPVLIASAVVLWLALRAT